ncbi:hypothetical protein TBLA_0B02510 [Henningerozyma blattae CBS 6284]|uniref:ERCC4 domain-containing protein n=1 Tax=Henningerozyma blattae (strain ATCC 34711 / CBS 6284 / DSM 70876 / NBRC 10599 / NRRL Y-10934 / UCD 77-7) TaxID=1071380 RepID=I2GY91_HENB6|nr:hypothetical protein TBLA_0B02510 [Tetrapisispora blattae CBS 6284]CCH59093.1 hypothetical protein TBLA_0B02510 [Tetrapisispora blattae CBS 6284]
MDDVIEILDDITNQQTPVKKVVEIFSISSDEENANEKYSPNLLEPIPKSSPPKTKITTLEVIRSSQGGNSLEIDLPFSDDASTLGDISVVKSRSNITDPFKDLPSNQTYYTKLKNRKENILDKILSDTCNSSLNIDLDNASDIDLKGKFSNIGDDSDSIEEGVILLDEHTPPNEDISLKNTTARWNKSTKYFSSSQDETELASNKRRLGSYEINNNTLENMPLSQPTPVYSNNSQNNVPTTPNFQETPALNNKRLKPSNEKNEDNNRQLFVENTSSNTSIGPFNDDAISPPINNINIVDPHIPSNFQNQGTTKLHNDVVELNLSKFLDEIEDISYSSNLNSNATSPTRDFDDDKTNTPDCTNHNMFQPNTEHSSKENLFHGFSWASLESYIINGKYLSKEKSTDLIRRHTQTNNQLFKQVNQIYRDNTVARSSLVVRIPKLLYDHFTKDNTNAIDTLLEPAKLEINYSTSNNTPSIEIFRKCDSVYDFNSDVYFPSEETIIEESIVVLYYSAQDFFRQYKESKKTILNEIKKLQNHKKFIILVLCDISKLRRDLESIENRIYREKVNNQLSNNTNSASQKKLSKNLERVSQLGLASNNLKEILRSIDRLWNVKLFTVNSDNEFINLLPNLLSLIGKQRKDPSIRFMKYAYMKVKSGKNKTDTLKKALHEVGRIPELKALNITSIYPSFQSLYHDFSMGKLKAGKDGKYLLAENVEKRLYKLFTCKDPTATID